MIRHAVTDAELRARIEKAKPGWFDAAAKALSSLPAKPKRSDFKPLWSPIKQVYIDLQHSKCCFCEKPLEGHIEQDVEHFRPKAEVRAWNVPPGLAAEGIVLRQPSSGAPEPGYARLAYEPLNYAMACKTCNSTLKKNFFPIEGTRKSEAGDPAAMAKERALLIYPLGAIDADPERLIGFDGLSPIPKKPNGFDRRRAAVTIEIFRLDSRPPLLKARAPLLGLLFHELEGANNAALPIRRKQHEDVIKSLTGPHSPFTNCMRCFRNLHKSDRTRAADIAAECLKLFRTKSILKNPRRSAHDDD